MNKTKTPQGDGNQTPLSNQLDSSYRNEQNKNPTRGRKHFTSFSLCYIINHMNKRKTPRGDDNYLMLKFLYSVIFLSMNKIKTSQGDGNSPLAFIPLISTSWTSYEQNKNPTRGR